MGVPKAINSWFSRSQQYHVVNPAPRPSSPANERTSLFHSTGPASVPTNVETVNGGRSESVNNDSYHSPLRQWLIEILICVRGSSPVILAYALQNSLQTISVLIVGRLSPEALATASFSYMFAMSTAWLIALGGSTALDTLASSAFTGSKNPHDLGVLLQRAFLVLTVLYIPIATLWAFSAPFFRILGQEEYICIESAKFLTALIPGGLGYIYFETMKKYLQAQGISYWLSFFLLVLYARCVAGSDCWGGWSRACLVNLATFARLAVLGFVHVGTEWWAFEIVALAAGSLGTTSLAAQSVIMTTDQIMNTIPFGIGVATSARVGNLLGARNAAGAARAANVAAWLSMIIGALVLVILLAVKNFYAKIFNNDAAVVKLTAEVIPWVAAFQIADGLNGSCGGSLRGMGRQHIGAAVNIISYYMLALPLGTWLAFHGWGLAGLWVGLCLALYLVGSAEWIIILFSNWEWQVEKAFSRMDGSERERLLPNEV